jgi:hypothetical protein
VKRIEEITHQNILFSALNWGYGHVMRSIILLKKFVEQGNRLYIVCDEEQLPLYESEGISAEFIVRPGYPFYFQGKGAFTLDILKSYHKLSKHIKYELNLVADLSKKHNIDLILSDQKMGFRNPKVKSIIITHQVNLPLRIYELSAQWLYNRWLNQFNEIWIPDQLPPNNIAGKLSFCTKPNAYYIGWLSRFQPCTTKEKLFKYGVLVTGPEPYAKSFFEEQLLRLQSTKDKSFIIYNKTVAGKLGNIEILQHLPSLEMAKYICACEIFISRCGYSTLMDISALKLENVELQPTPGQQEQLYLKKLWDEHQT